MVKTSSKGKKQVPRAAATRAKSPSTRSKKTKPRAKQNSATRKRKTPVAKTGKKATATKGAKPKTTVRKATNTIELFKLFKTVQENIVERLKVNSEVFSHPVVKGDASEEDWYQVLKAFLPERYEVSHGVFIIDGHGNASDWIDLVIHDRFYSPLFFTVGKTKCIPAESVHAVFEVKPDFDGTNLDYGAAKAASVRNLKRTSVGYPTTLGKAKKTKPKPIIAGLLATQSSYSPATSKVMRDKLKTLNAASRLDFVCVLNEVSFIAQYKPSFSLQTSKKEAVLMFFLVKLLQMMVMRGPTPQLDLSIYSAVLDGPKVT